MSTLHIVNCSPRQGEVLRDALAAMQPDDHLILIEDAVYALLDQTYLWPESRCHILQEDVNARGLTDKAQASACACVDIQGFVALACLCKRTVSWH